MHKLDIRCIKKKYLERRPRTDCKEERLCLFLPCYGRYKEHKGVALSLTRAMEILKGQHGGQLMVCILADVYIHMEENLTTGGISVKTCQGF